MATIAPRCSDHQPAALSLSHRMAIVRQHSHQRHPSTLLIRRCSWDEWCGRSSPSLLDVVTQLAIGGTLAALGYQARTPAGHLSVATWSRFRLGTPRSCSGSSSPTALRAPHGRATSSRRGHRARTLVGFWLIAVGLRHRARVISRCGARPRCTRRPQSAPEPARLAARRLAVRPRRGVAGAYARNPARFLLHRFDVWLGAAPSTRWSRASRRRGHFELQGLDAGLRPACSRVLGVWCTCGGDRRSRDGQPRRVRPAADRAFLGLRPDL